MGQADDASLGCSFHPQAPLKCRRTEGGCPEVPPSCSKRGKHNSKGRRASLVVALQGTGEDMDSWQSHRSQNLCSKRHGTINGRRRRCPRCHFVCCSCVFAYYRVLLPLGLHLPPVCSLALQEASGCLTDYRVVTRRSLTLSA